jgi:transposase
MRYNADMGKLTIAQAAQRLGTSEQVIRSWIKQGLLQGYSELQTLEPSHLNKDKPVPLYCLTARAVGVKEYVDEDELYEVAEVVGWLMLTEETWEKDETP